MASVKDIFERTAIVCKTQDPSIDSSINMM